MTVPVRLVLRDIAPELPNQCAVVPFHVTVPTVRHIFAGTLKITAGSPLDWPNPHDCAAWLVASSLGGYFRIVLFHFLLPCPSARWHSSRSSVL